MRILIVGGTSSLAQALKPVLSEFAQVITAGRTNCDLHLDLNDPLERMGLPADVDVVLNTAATFGGYQFGDILEAQNVNVAGVLKLCQASMKAEAKHLVLISSLFASLSQSSPFYNIYALSKKQSDELAQLYSTSFGLPLTIIRPSQIYGVGFEHLRKHQPFFARIIESAANHEDIDIYGSNDPRRNFIHVNDVAKIISLVIQNKIEGTFACMNPKDVSYSEIAQAAIAAFASKSIVRFLPDKPDIPNNVFEIDTSLYRLVNYYPQISISQGMEIEANSRKIVR